MYMGKFFVGSFLIALCFPILTGAQVIRGTIRTPNNTPIPYALVEVVPHAGGVSADAEGNYSLTLTTPGKYILRASQMGYRQAQQLVEAYPTDTVTTHFILTDSIYFIPSDITIIGNRLPIASNSISGKTLENNNFGQDIPILLAQQTSVSTTSDAGTGIGYTSLRIRGTDATRINVTLNGIPVNDAESQQVYWVDLPDLAASTNDITIQRGVGTSVNGAAAFGGTIDVDTRTPHPQPFIKATLAGGAFGTLRSSAQIATGTLGKGFAADARASYITSQGYIDRASSQLHSANINLSYTASTFYVYLMALHGKEKTYQAWYGVPADSIETNPTYNPAGNEKPDEPYQNQIDNYAQTYCQLHTGYTLRNGYSAKLALHYTKGRGYYEEYKANQAIADYALIAPDSTVTHTDLVRRKWLDNDFAGITTSVIKEGKSLDWIWGTALNKYFGQHFGTVVWATYNTPQNLHNTYYNDHATKLDGASYLKIIYNPTPQITLLADAQYRLVNYRFTGLNTDGNALPARVQHHFFNPKVGITYQYQHHTAYLSAALAHKEPNRDDYTNNPSNAYPTPEKLYDTELGYRFNTQNTFVVANTYFMWYRDQLVLTGKLNDVGAYIRTNVPQSYRMGIELEVNHTFSQNFSVAANATLSQNKIIRYTEYLDTYDAYFNWVRQTAYTYQHTNLAFSPALLAGITPALSYPIAKNTLRITAPIRYTGAQYLDNTQNTETRLKAYLQTDLNLFFNTPNDLLTIQILARNLLNKPYISNGWAYTYQADDTPYYIKGYYPQAAFHIMAGLTLTIR